MVRRRLTFLCLLLAVAGGVHAQETTTGSLYGTVTDAQGGVLRGALVTVASNQGPREFVTDAEGAFFAPFLTPGVYAVRASLPGFRIVERTGLRVSLGERLEAKDLVLQPERTEAVDVEGSGPVVDLKTTTVGGTLDYDVLARLPVGRNFTDALYMVPGVSSSSMPGGTNPAISGASGLDNNYVIDGINVTNAGYGSVGSYSEVFFSLGAGFTNEFIKETQVKTAGFEAEYGQATGGVVNVVTQSGTNAWGGSAYGFWRPPALESEHRQLVSPYGTVNFLESATHDFGATVSGPLAKDRLFLFAVFNPQYERQLLVPPTNVDPATGQPSFVLARNPAFADGVERKRRIFSYAAKLTWQAGARHRVDVSVFGDPSRGEEGPQRYGALVVNSLAQDGTPTAFSELRAYGGDNEVVKYDGIMSPRWLVEASLARAHNVIDEVPSADVWRVVDLRSGSPQPSGGIGYYEGGNAGTNVQLNLKSTHFLNGRGRHEVRYGVLHEHISFSWADRFSGPPIVLPNGVVTSSGAHVVIQRDANLGQIYRVNAAFFGPLVDTSQRYTAAFLQDTWTLGRLTLRPGLRYERQRLIGNEEFALCHEDDPSTLDRSGTGAPMACEMTWGNNWSPRLGATWDVRGDGRAKVFASWGRYFSKIPNSLAGYMLAGMGVVTRADYYDAALTQPIPDGVRAGTPAVTSHFQTLDLSAYGMDPESKSGFQDEILAGLEIEPRENLGLGLRWIHRSMSRVLEDVGPAAISLYACAGDPTGPCAPYADYDVSSIATFVTNPRAGYPATIGNVGAFEDIRHLYDAVEATASGRFGSSSLTASYRWSSLRGNFEGFYRTDTGSSIAAYSTLFDFPTNDPSYAEVAPYLGLEGDVRYLGCTLGCGVLPNDRPHQLKLFGNVSRGPLNVGVAFNLGSGKPLTALRSQPAYAGARGEIPATLRGGGFPVVANPAETGDPTGPAEVVTEFRTRTKMDQTLDARLDWTLTRDGRHLVLSADVFNVLNRQEPLNYDDFQDHAFGVPNPNFAYPAARGPDGRRFSAFQRPRAIRLGARLEW